MKQVLSKKSLKLTFCFLIIICGWACEPDPCTKTIDTINGPMTIDVDCAFAD